MLQPKRLQYRIYNEIYLLEFTGHSFIGLSFYRKESLDCVLFVCFVNLHGRENKVCDDNKYMLLQWYVIPQHFPLEHSKSEINWPTVKINTELTYLFVVLCLLMS